MYRIRHVYILSSHLVKTDHVDFLVYQYHGGPQSNIKTNHDNSHTLMDPNFRTVLGIKVTRQALTSSQKKRLYNN